MRLNKLSLLAQVLRRACDESSLTLELLKTSVENVESPFFRSDG